MVNGNSKITDDEARALYLYSCQVRSSQLCCCCCLWGQSSWVLDYYPGQVSIILSALFLLTSIQLFRSYKYGQRGWHQTIDLWEAGGELEGGESVRNKYANQWEPREDSLYFLVNAALRNRCLSRVFPIIILNQRYWRSLLCLGRNSPPCNKHIFRIFFSLFFTICLLGLAYALKTGIEPRLGSTCHSSNYSYQLWKRCVCRTACVNLS